MSGPRNSSAVTAKEANERVNPGRRGEETSDNKGTNVSTRSFNMLTMVEEVARAWGEFEYAKGYL